MNRWNLRGAVLLPWLAIAFGYLYHPHPKLMMKGSCPDLKDAKSLSLKKTAQISKPSPFSCGVQYKPDSTPVAVKNDNGRGWDASLSLEIANQVLLDAVMSQTVTKNMMAQSLRLLEHYSRFEFSSDKAADLPSTLNGCWRLIFSSGDFVIDHQRDKHGYVNRKDSVDFRFDFGRGILSVDTTAGTLPKTFNGAINWMKPDQLLCDFENIKIGTYEMLSNNDLFGIAPIMYEILKDKAMASMHFFAVEKGHMAMRFSFNGRSSLLVFRKDIDNDAQNSRVEKNAIKFSKEILDLAKRDQQRTSSGSSVMSSIAKNSEGSNPKIPRSVKRKFKRESHLPLGGYSSIWDYIQEEGTSLYLVFVGPTLLKCLPTVLKFNKLELDVLKKIAEEAWHHLF